MGLAATDVQKGSVGENWKMRVGTLDKVAFHVFRTETLKSIPDSKYQRRSVHRLQRRKTREKPVAGRSPKIAEVSALNLACC